MTNIEHIIAELRAAGVVFKLRGMRFTYTEPPQLSEGHRTGIIICRQSILEALQAEAGLCITCGEGKAEHPSYIGYAGKKGTKNENVRKDTPQEKRKPQLWCRECYHNGNWKRAFPIEMFERK